MWEKNNLIIPTNPSSSSMKPPFIQVLLLLLLPLFLLPCHASDRLPLLFLKASITDDPLQALSSWNDSTNFCLWQGVTCGNRHFARVINLDLSSFNVAGTIPPAIANLTFLHRLNLADNRFHGQIPPELGNLRRLLYLNLSSNTLDGVIPATLSHCSKLQVIALRNNKLQGGIPHNLSNCLNLQIITLKNNELIEGIPGSYGVLRKLVYLDVASNNITGIIPSSLGNISSLIALEVYENSISGVIPPILSQLSSLVFLRLYRNRLSGSIPYSIGNLSSLQFFDLSYNNLTGELPISLGNLSSLELLDVTTNFLSGAIPSSLGRLSSLTVLALTANFFSGGIPSSLGYLSSLSVMALSHNILSGEVPPSIYNISLIEHLGMANNNLVGTLPPDFGQNFPHLQKFFIYFNHFHGSIPSSLVNATALQDIELTGNNFTGKIPANLGMLQQLYWLSLDRNQLEAGDEAGWRFFSSLTNCSLLQVLALEENGLGGALPRSVGNLSKTMEWLSMGGNQLTGTIPDTIGKLQSINTLDLSFNELSGAIPGSTGNLSKLTLLTLKDNDLEDNIPASLGGCQALGTLDLSNNKLTGSIPKEVLSLSSLSKYLDLSNNLLTGPLPLEVGRLRNLKELDLESNNLSGEIPNTIGECEVLEFLFMNNNSFEGLIPPSFNNLKGIQEIDLAGNNLSGSIPEFLEGLSFLQYLNLSFNKFEGQVPSKGVFQNTSAFSVQGNEQLCGDPKLNLPACSSEIHTQRDRSRRLKIILPVAVCALLVFVVLCLLGFWYWIHESRKTPHEDSMEEAQHAKVSYFDILKATDGFSPSNLIGAGGHGSVYKGVLNFGEDKVVAVKVLNLQQKGSLKSFTAECNALKAIRHRNLIKIITSCSSVDNKGNMFKALIFQYMSNGSLEEWLHSEARVGSSLSFQQRINVAVDVASALEYLHHHGSTPMVHCDIKPSNVLLDDDMTAHVSDFGLAKLLGTVKCKSNQNSTSSIGVKGTVGYAAPEYGMGNQVSVKGDTYSYGLLLLEMFTRKRPTDEFLKDGLTLHRLVEIALPEQVMNIIDPSLISEMSGEFLDARKLKEYLILVLQIGLSCSKELPSERMEIRRVLKELHEIREAFDQS